MTIRVLIADDHDLVRAGFSVLIAATPGLAVVGEAGTGHDAVSLARRTCPDIVLMDIEMPGLNGIEATRKITEGPDTRQVRVLILTTFDLDEYIYAALRAGASGFLLKDTRPNDLLNAVHVIASGDALLAPSITRRLIQEFAYRPEPAQAPRLSLANVTERERDVLMLVAEGLSNAEIAARLHISPATARTHVSRLLTKLSARDRIQLVILAYRTGLVTPI